MRIRESSIFLREMHFHARHGVLPQERTVGGDFTVSLRVTADVSRAVAADDLEGTVNYADLYKTVKRQMEQPSLLLEHVAGRIGQAVLDDFPQVTAVSVQVRKDNPPMGADCEGAGVELNITRA